MYQRDSHRVVHNTDTHSLEVIMMKRQFSQQISNLESRIAELEKRLNNAGENSDSTGSN